MDGALFTRIQIEINGKNIIFRHPIAMRLSYLNRENIVTDDRFVLEQAQCINPGIRGMKRQAGDSMGVTEVPEKQRKE